MKKIIALMMALMMVLALAACVPANNSGATADQTDTPDVETYSKDFEGLTKYIADRNKSAQKSELFYDIVGADNGARFLLNGNAYVEVYDYSTAKNDTAKAILEDIRDDGKFAPLENGTVMTGVITDSGKYVLAWDATRGFDYEKNVATEELKTNW